ncbi:MAG: HigA family addiction module antidote protein [Desulfovibrionaceae bacterium]|nr:HigA family addiction module antidote protein [Desulfovibrionaceae bacterium]
MRVRTHPGEVLKEDFLVPMGISKGKLAEAIGVPVSVITDLVEQRLGIDAEMATRFSRYFGTSAEFWCNLQAAYDLSVVAMTKEDELAGIIPHRQAVEATRSVALP